MTKSAVCLVNKMTKMYAFADCKMTAPLQMIYTVGTPLEFNESRR